MSKTREKPHFLWSVFFMVISALFCLYFTSIGILPFWTSLGAFFSALTFLLIMYEKRHNELGKGNLLWSLFFATVTVTFMLGIAGATNFSFIPIISAASAIIALSLLVYEQYQY